MRGSQKRLHLDKNTYESKPNSIVAESGIAAESGMAAEICIATESGIVAEVRAREKERERERESEIHIRIGCKVAEAALPPKFAQQLKAALPPK